MSLGYDGKLYILAFDHRGSFQKKMFGIEGEPTAEETARIADAKHLIYEGLEVAIEGDAEAGATGALVDEQFGGEIPQQAKSRGLVLSMPVEKSGQNEFDFDYGEDFGAHIERFDPDFAKVLVRYNPEDDAELNRRQAQRLKRLSDWLHANERKFLFELLVPATGGQLDSVGASADRYDSELRPDLMIGAIREMQEAGVEADVWKIEGVDERSDCERIVAQARSGGRDGVTCVVLGRGASVQKVNQWLEAGAGVDGYVGFAIGRSIWWDALKEFLDGSIEREDAARRIAERYLEFVAVYKGAAQPA